MSSVVDNVSIVRYESRPQLQITDLSTAFFFLPDAAAAFSGMLKGPLMHQGSVAEFRKACLGQGASFGQYAEGSQFAPFAEHSLGSTRGILAVQTVAGCVAAPVHGSRLQRTGHRLSARLSVLMYSSPKKAWMGQHQVRRARFWKAAPVVTKSRRAFAVTDVLGRASSRKALSAHPLAAVAVVVAAEPGTSVCHER